MTKPLGGVGRVIVGNVAYLNPWVPPGKTYRLVICEICLDTGRELTDEGFLGPICHCRTGMDLAEHELCRVQCRDHMHACQKPGLPQHDLHSCSYGRYGHQFYAGEGRAVSFAEGYVDVATRIAKFREKYPEGCLRPFDPAEPIKIIHVGERIYLQYVACAYRKSDDPNPGIGIAWEPYPGKTPYTRDSEAMVAETSAWGRALVAALAVDTRRGIASEEEVRNRAAENEPVNTVPPVAAAKARAWNALKKMKPDEENDTLTEFTKAALEARGSSIADADTATWNALAEVGSRVTDRKALAARSLVEATILKLLKAAHEQTRTELGALFQDAGEREVGTLQDHRIGTVSLEAGRVTWSVVDEEKFLHWAKANYPGEIVEAVRPSFRDAVLARCKREGGYVDWDTGAVEVPAGVASRQGGPSLVERTDEHASFVVTHWLGAEAAERLGIEAE